MYYIDSNTTAGMFNYNKIIDIRLYRPYIPLSFGQPTIVNLNSFGHPCIIDRPYPYARLQFLIKSIIIVEKHIISFRSSRHIYFLHYLIHFITKYRFSIFLIRLL